MAEFVRDDHQLPNIPACRNVPVVTDILTTPLRTIQLVTAVLVGFNFTSVKFSYFLVDKPVFVRSGILYVSDGKSWYAGIYGYWWSTHASTTNSMAYNLSFNASDTYPSFGSSRVLGFPLRCLSTVLDIEKQKTAPKRPIFDIFNKSWYARLDSNQRPFAPQANALSN